MIKVMVIGSNGKMGRQTVDAVSSDDSLDLVARIDTEDDLGNALALSTPDVAIDFTHPSCVYENTRKILNASCHALVGTTGLSDIQMTELGELAELKKRVVFVVPNFAIGAVLMMRFAAEASKYMPHAEIIEYHHDKKVDAPSGTAIKTAELMAQSESEINSHSIKETMIIEGVRGGRKQNIPIHSLRLPGFVASQEIILGSQGQRLTLRHDTVSRDSFMDGVCLAVKRMTDYTGLLYGLEAIL